MCLMWAPARPRAYPPWQSRRWIVRPARCWCSRFPARRGRRSTTGRWCSGPGVLTFRRTIRVSPTFSARSSQPGLPSAVYHSAARSKASRAVRQASCWGCRCSSVPEQALLVRVLDARHAAAELTATDWRVAPLLPGVTALARYTFRSARPVSSSVGWQNCVPAGTGTVFPAC